jgi:hypothetical protein
VKAIDGLFHDPETGSSGPDPIDVMHWNKWGITDEMTYALLLLKDVRDRYQDEIERRGRPEVTESEERLMDGNR